MGILFANPTVIRVFPFNSVVWSVRKIRTTAIAGITGLFEHSRSSGSKMNTTRLLNLGFIICALVTSPLVILGDEPPGETSAAADDSAAGVVRVIPTVGAVQAPAQPVERQLSPADDVLRVLPANDMRQGGSIVPRDKMVGMRFRLDRQAAGSGVVGNDVGDTSFDFFWPFEANGDDRFLFIDLRTQMNDQGRGGASTGMGYRSYNENLDRIFGLSGWWDWDNSHHRAYRQAGASFESLGQFFDFRANGYFPLSNEYHTVYDRTDYSNPQFGGFNVLVDRTRIFESNYRGVDAEVGGPLPVLGRYGARGYMGIYHWSSETDADTTGWKARVETQVTDDLMIGVSVSDDSLFGTNTWLNIVLTLPDGRPETFFRPQTMRQRLNGSVRRNRRVVVNRRRQVDMVPLVNSSGANAGNPMQLVWIDPNAAFNGNGSYESPLNNLETFNNVPGNDMLIVGSGDLTGSVTLFEDQQLLSEWSLNQQQYNLATTAGLIPLPAADPMATKPTFRNPLGVDGNDGGTIVSIAGSNTEIGGIIFDGQTDISGVYANAITTAPGWSIGGFNIHDNEFDRTRNSVVFNNSISSGAGYALGIFEQNQLRGNGFDSIAGFQLTATDGSLLNLRVDGNSVSNYRGEDLDSDGELDPGEDTNGNGVLDAGVAFSITANERAVINAVTIPGDPADPSDPGLPLGITDNVAVSNGTGLLLLTETEGIINADVSGNTFSNNFDPNTGVSVTADNGTINLLSFLNNDVNDNLGVGMRLTALGGGTIAGVASEDRNRNGILDPTEDSNGNGLLDIGEDLNGNGVLDGAEDTNGNGLLDHGFTGNTIIGNGGDGLVVMANDGTISNLSIGSASDLLPDDKVFDLLGEVDANGDGILNRGNGNGILDPGEDVNLNGLLDPGEDDNEDRNNNGIRDQVNDRFIGALPGEDANGDGVLNVGNGNGVLDDGEDVNENGVLDLGEDFNEDFNGNGLLDGPDNVITGNGVSGSGGGSGVVLRTLPTEDANGDGLLNVGNGNGTLDPGEDVNGNGLLDAGEDFNEDANGNGRLDLGGGTITASLVNTFLDNTIVDIDGGTFLQNNTGSQLLIEADGGSSGSGSIILSSIANNSMTGAGLDSITIDSNNAGSVLIGEIKNSTLDNNVRNGINVESDTGTVSLGTVDSNTFNRIYNGVDGIHIETDDAIVTGIVTRSRFQADPVGNINEDTNGNGVLDLGEDLNGNGLLESGAGIGFVVRATGGNTSLEIGQTDLGNVFDQNAGTAIEYTLIEGGQGQVAIRDNQIRGTTAIDTDGDGVADSGGDGIVVRTLGDLQGGVGNPVLHDSIIDGNLIGSLATTEDTNGNSLLDPGEDINGNGLLDLSLVNEGHGVRFDIQEQSTVSNVGIGYADAGDDSLSGNEIINNGLDGIFIERLDDAIINGLFINNNLIEGNGINQVFTDRQSALGNGISIAARDGGDSVLGISATLNEIRGNQFNGVKLLVDGDARLQFDMFRNLVKENGVGDPTGASLTAGILTLENFNDATDKREIVGTWSANQFVENTGYGIRFDSTATSLYNLDGDPEIFDPQMQIVGNLIDGNGLDGIEFNGVGQLLIDSNDIINNGFNADLSGAGNDDNGNGIDIQAVLLTAAGAVEDQLVEPEEGLTQAAALRIVHIDRNTVRDNALDGLEIRHANNPSQFHGHNSLHAPLHPGHYPLNVIVRENTFENNGGRGIDILNQGGHRTPRPVDIDPETGEDEAGQFSPTDTFVRLVNNEIISNDKEGIYVVNSAALSQLQSGNTPTPGTPDDPSRGMVAGDSDDFDGRPGDDASPRLVIEVHDNQIFDNGQLLDHDRETGNGIATLSGSGLVFRVGTTDYQRGLDTFASSPDDEPLFEESGFFNRKQPGGVIAKVSSNELGSNFGSDVYIESFVSTDPDHDLNPVARLDMIFENNLGESLSVTNHGAWYPGPDGIRANGQNLPLDQDLGGFPTPLYGYIVGVHSSSVSGGPSDGNATSSVFDGNLDLETRSSIYNGHEVEFIGGNQTGEWRFVSAYSASASQRRVSVNPALPGAPAIGDSFQIELSTEDWFDVALLDADPREDLNAQVIRHGPATDAMTGLGAFVKFLDGPLDGAIATVAENYQMIDGVSLPGEDANVSEFHWDQASGIKWDDAPGQPGGAVVSGENNDFIGIGVGSNQTFVMENTLTRPPRDGDLFLLSAVLPGQGTSAFRVSGATIHGGAGVETNNFDVHNLGFEHKVSLETTLPSDDEKPFQWDLLNNTNSSRIRSFFDVLPDLSTNPPVTYKDFLP